ncbi:MAG: hypothetical protein JO317_05230 [Verrucomicrobiae bacterium]|nr:hypothetical protein [Verrucomicrobiae bacterium]
MTTRLWQWAGAGLALAATLVWAEDTLGWHSDCGSVKDWYTKNEDPSFQAKLDPAEPGVLKLTQEGTDTWGKAAFVVKDVDLDKTPILEVKVNKVDKDAAYKVGVAPLDWSELFVVVPRSSADGVSSGNIKTATGWSGKKSFNVVLIVEGKSKAVWFDDIKIKNAAPTAK